MKSYDNFPRRERAETHDNSREVALSESLLASYTFTQEVPSKPVGTVFYMRMRTAEE